MNSSPTNLQVLFEVQVIPKGVLLKMTDASVTQARALASMLNRTRALGEFRHTQSPDGSDVQLTFFRSNVDQVTRFLCDTSVDTLMADIAMIEDASATYASNLVETKRVNNLSIRDFGQLLNSRSVGKLLVVDPYEQTKLLLRTSVLIPVTHFKTLASLTKYDGKTRTFTVQRAFLGESTREKLLQLADKLAKSTKRVTLEDIAARRARREAPYSHLNHEELEQLIEDHMYDVFGHETPENWRLSREAILGKD
jgi:hypothetical protein